MKKYLFFCLAILCCIFVLTTPALANSAEPPGIILITSGLPEDAVITMEVPGKDDIGHWRTYRTDKLWESQYKLYFHLGMDDISGARLRVTTGEDSFTCQLPEGEYRQFTTILTLDYANKTLKLGQDPWRQPLLTVLRVTLTLLTEGVVFYLFGFRKKSSWIAFVLINLVTQGWLNIAINSYGFSGYWVIGFVLMEAAVFLVEAFAFPLAVREKKDWQRVLYSLVANAASLALGILLIDRLPL